MVYACFELLMRYYLEWYPLATKKTGLKKLVLQLTAYLYVYKPLAINGF